MTLTCTWCGKEGEVPGGHEGWWIPPSGWLVTLEQDYDCADILHACSPACIDAYNKSIDLDREFRVEVKRAHGETPRKLDYREADTMASTMAEERMAEKHGANWRKLMERPVAGGART